MTCEELLRLLGEYLDGELEGAAGQELREHLHGCEPCKVVVDNVRQTITVYNAGKPYQPPAEFQKRLYSLVEERFRARFPPACPPGLKPESL